MPEGPLRPSLVEFHRQKSQLVAAEAKAKEWYRKCQDETELRRRAEAEIHSMRSDRADADARIGSDRKNDDKKAEECAELRKTNRKLRAELDEFRAEHGKIKELKRDNEKLAQECEELKETREKKAQEYEELKKTNKKLEANLGDVREEQRKELKRINEKLEVELDEARGKLKGKAAQIHEHWAQAKLSNQLSEDLRRDYDKLVRTNQKLGADLDEVRGKCAETEELRTAERLKLREQIEKLESTAKQASTAGHDPQPPAEYRPDPAFARASPESQPPRPPVAVEEVVDGEQARGNPGSDISVPLPSTSTPLPSAPHNSPFPDSDKRAQAAQDDEQKRIPITDEEKQSTQLLLPNVPNQFSGNVKADSSIINDQQPHPRINHEQGLREGTFMDDRPAQRPNGGQREQASSRNRQGIVGSLRLLFVVRGLSSFPCGSDLVSSIIKDKLEQGHIDNDERQGDPANGQREPAPSDTAREVPVCDERVHAPGDDKREEAPIGDQRGFTLNHLSQGEAPLDEDQAHTPGDNAQQQVPMNDAQALLFIEDEQAMPGTNGQERDPIINVGQTKSPVTQQAQARAKKQYDEQVQRILEYGHEQVMAIKEQMMARLKKWRDKHFRRIGEGWVLEDDRGWWISEKEQWRKVETQMDAFVEQVNIRGEGQALRVLEDKQAQDQFNKRRAEQARSGSERQPAVAPLTREKQQASPGNEEPQPSTETRRSLRDVTREVNQHLGWIIRELYTLSADCGLLMSCGRDVIDDLTGLGPDLSWLQAECIGLDGSYRKLNDPSSNPDKAYRLFDHLRYGTSIYPAPDRYPDLRSQDRYEDAKQWIDRLQASIAGLEFILEELKDCFNGLQVCCRRMQTAKQERLGPNDKLGLVVDVQFACRSALLCRFGIFIVRLI
ncbi:MAG: hypothetical protein Q9208_005769 [Pyrenodesmia sp. 3 TL-2023]